MKIKLTKQMRAINKFFKYIEFYYVGGCVRDSILDCVPNDYDLITPLTPTQIEDYCKGNKKVLKTGRRYGTLSVMINNQQTEITTFRNEIYDFKSRKPMVSYTTDIIKDLQRRDFTVNSLVCDKKGNVIDHTESLQDLNLGILRAVGDAKKRFQEDPLRILRAIRFKNKYGYIIDTMTEQQLFNNVYELYRLSKERIISEIDKMFELDNTKALKCIMSMHRYGILTMLLPIYTYINEDTIEDWVGDNPDAGWKLLFDIIHDNIKHDGNHRYIIKDMANDFMLKYKFSNERRQNILEEL